MDRRRNHMFFIIVFLFAAVVILPAAAFGKVINLNTKDTQGSNTNINITKTKEISLPSVGSFANFTKLIQASQKYVYLMEFDGAAKKDVSFGVTRSSMNSSTNSSNQQEEDYSSTNVQVQGVDEADVVKTDGKYIYYLSNHKLTVVNAYPPKAMKVESTVRFDGNKFDPFELYVDDKYLIVIGGSNREAPVAMIRDSNKNDMPPYYPNKFQQTTKAIIYDLSSKRNLKQLREIEIDGNYAASRKIGSNIYFVTNKYVEYYLLDDKNFNIEPKVLMPSYRDTAVKNDFIDIDYSRIKYFPQCIYPNYVLVGGLNLEKMNEGIKVSAYLGNGGNIYASTDNLYIATAVNEEAAAKSQESNMSLPGSNSIASKIIIPNYNLKTKIYKFALRNGNAVCTAQGEVPGSTLNQFSIDENNGYLRIATTKGEIWRTDEQTSRNNLYILDSVLKVSGKIEDIAPGEKIYSVRFMGDRAYMVTFRTVDPLFVIDLKDPQNPEILGSLKIPGYSQYLHPYDENHIIGFGKDTVEVTDKDQNGNVINTRAYYLGMKIAIFDVTNVEKPVEMFSEKIGGRGTDSELLSNHKALMFSKEKNLLAFPVTVMETEKENLSNSMPQYGKFTFQGAYVYNIDLTKGFVLKGRISHLTSEDYAKSGDYWYSSNKNVERILYAGNTLYTLSGAEIRANDIKDLRPVNYIKLP